MLKTITNLLHYVNPIFAVKATYHKAKEHGPWFLALAIGTEVFERIALPSILVAMGKSHWVPLTAFVHLELVVYPLYFGLRKLVAA